MTPTLSTLHPRLASRVKPLARFLIVGIMFCFAHTSFSATSQQQAPPQTNIQWQNGVQIHRHGPSAAQMQHVRDLAAQQAQRDHALQHLKQQEKQARQRAATRHQAQTLAYAKGFQDGTKAATPLVKRRNPNRYGRRYTTYFYGTQFGSYPRCNYARRSWVRRR